ncbi:MAG: anthranilate synthase component II (glutamine amido-transferase) [Osedax symbiont Rs1]|nr:MAG: anthranilate synthase component II (glutamine amido-transferase) [Osedax symbiont Rs1]
MLLMIDNYDSFTYNLTQYLAELGAQVCVKRNNQISLAQISELQPEALVISPGPCGPLEAGICVAAIAEFGKKIPVLGVCLGHQSIAVAFGGKVVRAKKAMHGKISLIKHNNQGLFKGLDNPLQVTRYHSLVVDPSSLPECLEITAWTENADGSVAEIMGLKHTVLPIQGVQFHPESILTIQGHQLLNNFVNP